ncbi:MAG TPA: hypothetical protein PKA41_18385 [Verrucomicrobiota bacterium]|nr:hypothetical protein [Verrucomicrobiota bacterium]
MASCFNGFNASRRNVARFSAACPVGAIGADGAFNFSACYTHNYREFLGGFEDWVETVAGSRDEKDYRRRVKDSESVSVWQNLSFGANYKAAYCMAVCSAGEDMIGPYLASKKASAEDVVRPLQAKRGPVYVVRGSDAEAHVQKRIPDNIVRHMHNSLRPRSMTALLSGMPLTFQRHAAGKLDATYHFVFTGNEPTEATVTIRAGKVTVENGLLAQPKIKVIADSETWLGFLAVVRNLLWPPLTRRIRLQGNPKWLLSLKRCFPSGGSFTTSAALSGLDIFLANNPGRCPGLSSPGLHPNRAPVSPVAADVSRL